MGKVFKFVLGGLILGVAVWLMDLIYDKWIEERLPKEFQRTANNPDDFGKEDALYYGILGAGAILITVPLVKILGLAASSPIKPEASPLAKVV